MTDLKTLVVALGVTLWLPVAARSETSTQPAETPAPSAEQPAAPAKCLEAAVNPVTGFAVCVNPRGAPVEAPPPSAFHPCKPRPQDKGGLDSVRAFVWLRGLGLAHWSEPYASAEFAGPGSPSGNACAICALNSA